MVAVKEIYIPGTQMTLVLVGKGIVLGGLTYKIEFIGALRGFGNALNLYARIALMTLGVCFAALFTIAKIMGLSVTYTIGATKTVYMGVSLNGGTPKTPQNDNF